MIIALIHWRIQPDETSKAAFLHHWKTNNTIGDRAGLIAEFLSDSLPMSDFKSYVTAGLWNDAEAFGDQVAAYFNDEKPMLPFEKYRRRRVIFRPVSWRIGHTSLPSNDSQGVL